MTEQNIPFFDRSTMTSKWQAKREEKKVYQTTESSDKPKYFALDMFPYPSGAGLHVGHPKGYIATDVISRKKHLEGYNVLHPMGFDSFGLPTENYAMKNKIHPSKATDDNIATFINQLKKIGFNYDRDRMVSTADPEFYKRTQRQFLQMYHHYFDHTAQKAKPISVLREILQGSVIPVEAVISGGNNKKYLIFDFDGVLADSLNACLNVRLQMGLANTLEEAQQQALEYSNNHVDHTKDHTMSKDEMQERIEFLKTWGIHQINIGFSLFEEFINEIALIDNIKVAVVSSNSIQVLESKAEELKKINPTHILGFEDHHSKEEKIEQICRDRGVDVSEIYYFTDTKADVYELQNMISKEKLIGCARGVSGYDGLSELLDPQYIMKEFSDIHKIVENGKQNIENKEITNYQSRYQTQTQSDPHFFASLTEEEKIEYYLDTEKRIAYISTAPINRCPSCMTALANEDLDGNNCERCGSSIERKKMRQWMIRITDYAQRLLDGLDFLPDRQDNIKAMQRHWIGKSEGTIVGFKTSSPSLLLSEKGEHKEENPLGKERVAQPGEVAVYTTRIDTIFGVTYVAIAPEYPDIEHYITPEQRAIVLAYIEESKNKTDLQRQESKEKTGVRTGSYVINPFNNEQVPLRVADYVLMDYGTGAVMAVPAHDERDREFAHKYDLPIKQVINPIYIREDARDKKDFIVKKKIVCIVEDQLGNIMTVNRGPNLGGRLFLGGTIEEKEDSIQTAIRELKEEAGYNDVEVISIGTELFDYKYFAHSKNQATQALTQFVHLRLRSFAQQDTQLEEDEKEKFVIERVDKSTAAKEVVEPLHVYAYKKFIAQEGYYQKGILTNSGEFSGLTSEEAISAMQSRLAERGVGGKKINYRLNNRVFSRQRYRGEPIPFVYKENQDTSSSHGGPIFIHAKLGKNLILDESKHRTLVDTYSHSDDDCIDIVGALIKDNTGAYYLHHKVKENYFLLPGGKVEKGESYEQAMIRELKEEMNIDVVSLSYHASVKRVINNCKYNVHYMIITEYTGIVEHLEADTFDLVHAEILPSHNRLGHAIKIDGTIIDDERDITHAFSDLALTVLQKPSLSQTIDSNATIIYPDHFDPSTIYYQYYDQSQKKYFFSKDYSLTSPSFPLPASQDISYQINPLQGQRDDHKKLISSEVDKGGDILGKEPSLKGEGGVAGGGHRIRVTPMDASELPLTLPDVAHYEPTGTEEGPLAKIESWINTTLSDGTPARRESNTMPGWAGSSRYRLRYMDPRNQQTILSPDKEQYRGQVDLYVGGMEHACRHLIYARFWHKFLKDIGVVSTEEPFKKLVGVGLVLAEDGRKMSKRRGNVINPDDVIAEFGTDAFRTYEMFMGPFGSEVARSTAGVKGVRKFLDKIIKLSSLICHPEFISGSQDAESSAFTTGDLTAGHNDSKEYKKALTLLHKTIKKVSEDIDNFSFNTAISALMIYVNHLEEVFPCRALGNEYSWGEGAEGGRVISLDLFEPLIQLIAPFAPHLAEELREKLGHTTMLYEAKNWPSYDPALLVDDVITMGVQFNGKMKGTIEIAPTATQDEALALVQADVKLASNFTGDTKKIIYVPGRILNIVVG